MTNSYKAKDIIFDGNDLIVEVDDNLTIKYENIEFIERKTNESKIEENFKGMCKVYSNYFTIEDNDNKNSNNILNFIDNNKKEDNNAITNK